MQLLNYSVLILLLCSLSHYGQTIEPSTGVGRSRLQLELESLYVMEKEDGNKINSWSIPSFLIRYGISDAVELQINVPYVMESKYKDDSMVSSRTFLDNVQAGVSVNLWHQKGILPQAAIMARALIPIYDYNNSDIGSLVALNLSNSLTDQLSLNYNLGWIADQSGNSAYYIANLSWNMSTVVHSFVEFFGSTYNNINMNHNINSGIGFNLGNSFCLDLSIASGLNQEMVFFGGVLTYQIEI